MQHFFLTWGGGGGIKKNDKEEQIDFALILKS